MKTKDDIDIVDVEQRLYDLERKVTDMVVGKLSQPRTPRLVEACEITLAYVRNMDTEAVFESFHAMELALAAEKKRQELVNWLIGVAEGHRYKATNLDIALRAIENFEKGEAQ